MKIFGFMVCNEQFDFHIHLQFFNSKLCKFPTHYTTSNYEKRNTLSCIIYYYFPISVALMHLTFKFYEFYVHHDLHDGNAFLLHSTKRNLLHAVTRGWRKKQLGVGQHSLHPSLFFSASCGSLITEHKDVNWATHKKVYFSIACDITSFFYQHTDRYQSFAAAACL